MSTIRNRIAFALILILTVLSSSCGKETPAKERGPSKKTIPNDGADATPNDEADAPPSPVVKMLSDGMMEVPAGEFMMGSINGDADERPIRKVYLDGYAIDKTEVTNLQYKACVHANKCKAPIHAREIEGVAWDAPARAQHPVAAVNWAQANGYCEWAGKRLPTEAEWEKAAKGPTQRIYPWGEEEATCKYAVMEEIKDDKQRIKAIGGDGGLNSCGRGLTPWPVGVKLEGMSPYGVVDMSGNVSEWTADWYGPYATAEKRNPRGPVSGTERVHRGGSFSSDRPSELRASTRKSDNPTSAGGVVGFRCARDLTLEDASK